MKATDFATYEDYTASNTAKGVQVLPRVLWSALKNPRPILSGPATT